MDTIALKPRHMNVWAAHCQWEFATRPWPRREALKQLSLMASGANRQSADCLSGWKGLAETDVLWQSDFSKRKIIHGFMKDKSLGDKRLASMPDRYTNTINTVAPAYFTIPSGVPSKKGHSSNIHTRVSTHQSDTSLVVRFSEQRGCESAHSHQLLCGRHDILAEVVGRVEAIHVPDQAHTTRRIERLYHDGACRCNLPKECGSECGCGC